MLQPGGCGKVTAAAPQSGDWAVYEGNAATAI